MNLMNKLVGSSEDVVMLIKKNSPRILSIGSSVLAAGACVGTGVATWKAKERIEEHNDNIHILHEELHNAKDGEEVEQKKKDIMLEYGKTIATVGSYYAVPALMLGGSIACDIASSKQYEHKLALASGALVLLKGAYDRAQERAREKYGDEGMADIFYGSKEIEVEHVDEKGNVTIEKVKQYDGRDIIAANPCAILLGDGIDSNLTGDYWYDINLIKSIEAKFTYRLNSDGYVFVQDVYADLGVKPASKFQHDLWASYGWVKDQNKIDNYISKCKLEGIKTTDEGIMNANRIKLGLDDISNERYISKLEPTVNIIPNCIGDIMPYIYSDGKQTTLIS